MTNPLAAPFPMMKRPSPGVNADVIRFFALAVVTGVLFFVTEHNLTYTQTVVYDFAPTSADSASAVADGSSVRKISFLTLGLVGGLLLVRRQGRPFTLTDPLAWALLTYWAYCAASVAWSIEPSLTVRRVIVLSCAVLFVLGVVRQLNRLQLIQLAFLCSFAFVAAGFAAEVVLGAFRPWSGGYRFCGTVHPNSQGQLCAMLCLSAYAWFRQTSRGRWWLLAVMGFAVALLVLTKSRTSGIAVGLGMVALWAPLARRERIAFATFFPPFAACAAAVLAACLGYDIEGGASSALSMGRDDGVASFTGRVPLWSEVAPHILERPLLGHGYLTFWTPWRIQYTSELLGWTIPDAHNEYLETFLNLGLFGAALLGTLACGSLLRCVQLYLRTGDASIGFFAAQLFIALLSSGLESGFAQPLGLVSFFTACGVVYACCRLPAEAMTMQRIGSRLDPSLIGVAS